MKDSLVQIRLKRSVRNKAKIEAIDRFLTLQQYVEWVILKSVEKSTIQPKALSK